jgi:2-methylisocitrate lyase-like PEP mutase family enzyme
VGAIDTTDVHAHFLGLHHQSSPLLLANAWDTGSARLLASLGFAALATTSSGYAATLGRLDGSLTREEALAHSAQLAQATDLPVNADLENCFADEPAAAAETIRLALDTGVAGASIEDFTGDARAPIYDLGLAADRVRAAAEAAHAGPRRLVLTARAENHLHGRDDLANTIARLQAYQDAGADVLYAPGLTAIEDIRAVVSSVDLPVNVLAMAQTPPVASLAHLGVARISVGGSFAFAALAGVVEAARELLEQGTYGYTSPASRGRDAAQAAFHDLDRRPSGTRSSD